MITDRELALATLGALRRDPVLPERTTVIVHPGRPQPKARARTFKGRYFTSKETAKAEQALLTTFRLEVLERPWMCNVAIVAIFYRPTRQRTDLDNLMKLVMDAATKANVWRDDSQVTAQASFIELDPVNPRTVIALCPATSTLDRTVPLKKRGSPSLPLDERTV